mmetsp:Transcript_15349/g.58415  ORF Transcript_15349/g.58415 Transcript_15349/m.58415 type:complete len:94 (+) Transcript_15349:1325-1606(+)
MRSIYVRFLRHDYIGRGKCCSDGDTISIDEINRMIAIHNFRDYHYGVKTHPLLPFFELQKQGVWRLYFRFKVIYLRAEARLELHGDRHVWNEV